jgi:hypothetical protein
MKPHLSDILLLIVIGFLLVIADRYFRIERFANYDSLEPCGVSKMGLEPNQCKSGYTCMNGFCAPNTPPALNPTILPVFP